MQRSGVQVRSLRDVTWGKSKSVCFKSVSVIRVQLVLEVLGDEADVTS